MRWSMQCRVAERPCPNRLAWLSGQRSSISSDLLFYFVFLPSLVTVQSRRILSDRSSLVNLVHRRTLGSLVSKLVEPHHEFAGKRGAFEMSYCFSVLLLKVQIKPISP